MKPTAGKRIIISVTTDLVSDNRVHKVSQTLKEMGFQVLLAGRELPGSKALDKRSYQTRRLKLPVVKGPAFYVLFNIRLLFLLLFSKVDVLLANDLDTLPANVLASVIRRKPLIYDSHEYFTQVPELIGRPLIRRIWELTEKLCVPRVDGAYTVCKSIASIYSQKYNVPFEVVRNLPKPSEKSIKLPDLSEPPVILYQGALNMGRGLQEVILAMHHIEGAKLVLAGDGDIRNDLEVLVEQEKLTAKVAFRGRLSIGELEQLTPSASIGLSVEEDIGLNYHYALPNKLFDYIQAKVPVLVTNLPEMVAIVKQYNIGEVVNNLDPIPLAGVLNEMLHNREKRNVWKANLETASKELIWDSEEGVLRSIFKNYL